MGREVLDEETKGREGSIGEREGRFRTGIQFEMHNVTSGNLTNLKRGASRVTIDSSAGTHAFVPAGANRNIGFHLRTLLNAFLTRGRFFFEAIFVATLPAAQIEVLSLHAKFSEGVGSSGEGKTVFGARCETLVVFCVEGSLVEARERSVFVELDIIFRYVVTSVTQIRGPSGPAKHS